MHYSQILIRPIITEKANKMRDESNQIAFYVFPEANKIQIKKAVEEAFNVKALAVNIVNRRPLRRRRFGRAAISRVPGYAKAYVTLAPGDTVEIFEGV